MENKIRKAEFSDVLKIGQTVGKREYTKDEFYCDNGEGKRVLHLNKLAWEAPSIWTNKNGEEIRGFVPGDTFYEEIIAEFKSFKDKWREGNIVRKIIPNSQYDAIVIWYPEVKMVTWYFRASYEYCVD